MYLSSRVQNDSFVLFHCQLAHVLTIATATACGCYLAIIATENESCISVKIVQIRPSAH